uniref:Uncharacterized protein n=1 Tax=Cacopsylla melanoneura TaxID=428564 RepID=A0A8D8ZEG0_9HEMI
MYPLDFIIIGVYFADYMQCFSNDIVVGFFPIECGSAANFPLVANSPSLYHFTKHRLCYGGPGEVCQTHDENFPLVGRWCKGWSIAVIFRVILYRIQSIFILRYSIVSRPHC